jgi:hypothetical protein
MMDVILLANKHLSNDKGHHHQDNFLLSLPFFRFNTNIRQHNISL